MTREQLLALLRDAAEFIEHSATCEFSQRLLRLSFAELADDSIVDKACTCGMRLLMVRVEDALATERTETGDAKAQPYSEHTRGWADVREIKVADEMSTERTEPTQ